MNFRLACPKMMIESPSQDDAKNDDDDTDSVFNLDGKLDLDLPQKVDNFIQAHLDRFMQVAREYYARAKQTRKLKIMMSEKVPENSKKYLISYFTNSSPVLFEKKVPMFLIIQANEMEESKPYYKSTPMFSGKPNSLKDKGFIGVNTY